MIKAEMEFRKTVLFKEQTINLQTFHIISQRNKELPLNSCYFINVTPRFIVKAAKNKLLL